MQHGITATRKTSDSLEVERLIQGAAYNYIRTYKEPPTRVMLGWKLGQRLSRILRPTFIVDVRQPTTPEELCPPVIRAIRLGYGEIAVVLDPFDPWRLTVMGNNDSAMKVRFIDVDVTHGIQEENNQKSSVEVTKISHMSVTPVQRNHKQSPGNTVAPRFLPARPLEDDARIRASEKAQQIYHPPGSLEAILPGLDEDGNLTYHAVEDLSIPNPPTGVKHVELVDHSKAETIDELLQGITEVDQRLMQDVLVGSEPVRLKGPRKERSPAPARFALKDLAKSEVGVWSRFRAWCKRLLRKL